MRPAGPKSLPTIFRWFWNIKSIFCQFKEPNFQWNTGRAYIVGLDAELSSFGTVNNSFPHETGPWQRRLLFWRSEKHEIDWWCLFYANIVQISWDTWCWRWKWVLVCCSAPLSYRWLAAVGWNPLHCSNYFSLPEIRWICFFKSK